MFDIVFSCKINEVSGMNVFFVQNFMLDEKYEYMINSQNAVIRLSVHLFTTSTTG